MRILLLNQVFYPDVAASGQIGHDLARHLTAQGFDVTVIASRSLYGQRGAALPAFETVDGIRIHRVGVNLFGRRSLFLRAVDSMLFYVFALARAMLMRRPDVVVTFTSPPLIALVGYLMRLVRGCRFIYWVMDVYPDVGIHTGLINPRRLFVRWWDAANRFCMRHADRVVVLGRCMRQRLADKRIDPARVTIIGVWADAGEIAPMEPNQSPLRQEWSLGDKFVVMYSGNFSMAHDVETMCRAALILKDRADICFVFAGGGHRKAQVESFLAEHHLTNAQSRPYQPRECLGSLLGAADLHLVSQADNQWGLFVPSKLYGIMAAGRPAVFIGPAQAEAARVLEEHQCGNVVPCGQADRLAQIITHLADHRADAKAMGQRARQALEHHFDRPLLCQQWAELLKDVT